MQLIQSVRFNGTADAHIVNRFGEIETLSGIALRDERDPERKAFRRIGGNSATLDDLRTALTAALAEADRIARDAETAPCPFPAIPGRAPGIEQEWRDGRRSLPPRIRRTAKTLVDLIETETGIRLIAD